MSIDVLHGVIVISFQSHGHIHNGGNTPPPVTPRVEAETVTAPRYLYLTGSANDIFFNNLLTVIKKSVLSMVLHDRKPRH